MNATSFPPVTDAPERIAQLIWVLCQVVTERCSRRVHTLTAAQVDYIVARLLAARKRFRWVVDRIRAGQPPKARARKKRARPAPARKETLAEAERGMGVPPPPGWRRWAREDRARARAAEQAARALAAASRTVPLWRTLRQHLPGWLCGCAPTIAEFPRSAASCANELRRLLAEPEMQALLRSNRCLGDSLRQICWGLNVPRSLLDGAPSVPDSAVAAGPEPAIATPGEIVAAAPPASGAGAFSAVAVVPPPSIGMGAMPSSQAPPGAPPKEDFFARG